MRTAASLRRGRNDWYRIDNNVNDTAGAVDVHIYDEIGFWGVSAQDFVGDFRERVSATAAVNVYINSPGGSVFDGITILNTLRAHQGTVTTVVMGIAASAASFIAQAGSERVMASNATMMIHDASGLCIGNADDMRTTADLLDKASDNIARVYAERSARGTVEEWRAEMRKEVWYTDQEALDAGLIDRIDTGRQAETEPEDTWDLSVFAHAGRSDAPDPTVLAAVADVSTFDQIPEPERLSALARQFDFAALKKGLGS